MFPSQFQNDDIFQQLLVFLKNKDQEIGKSLRSQTAGLCNLSRVLMSPKRFSSEIVYTFSCFYWMFARNFWHESTYLQQVSQALSSTKYIILMKSLLCHSFVLNSKETQIKINRKYYIFLVGSKYDWDFVREWSRKRWCWVLFMLCFSFTLNFPKVSLNLNFVFCTLSHLE